MKNRVELSIKGRRPQPDYGVTLLDLFQHRPAAVLTRSALDQALRRRASPDLAVTANIIESIFPTAVLREQRAFRRYPCQMLDAPLRKVELNLLYQDTRVKLGVEETARRGAQPDRKRAVRELLEIYMLFLRTELTAGKPVWQECTDCDLDALTFALLDVYDPSRPARLLADGDAANRRSADRLARVLANAEPDLRRFVSYQINAGTVWWEEPNPGEISDAPPVIDDYIQFEREVLRRPCTLLFMVDDNGELVWDLMLIDRMLRINPQLEVSIVVSTRVVSNNASAANVAECLSWPLFADLQRNRAFRVIEEDNRRSAIDLSYCSRPLLDAVTRSDICFIKGVSFFETLQEVPTTAYYAFVVHSLDSQTCTGLRDGESVFARIPKGRAGFRYGSATLTSLRPSLESSNVFEPLGVSLKVKRIHPLARLPRYANPGDAGLDLFTIEAVEIPAGESALVRTGIQVELPPATEAQIRPRSGLALNHQVTVLNSPGTIDTGYRGEIRVILINHGAAPFHVSVGTRIAQMVVGPVIHVDVVDSEELSPPWRGPGFGSSGA